MNDITVVDTGWNLRVYDRDLTDLEVLQIYAMDIKQDEEDESIRKLPWVLDFHEP